MKAALSSVILLLFFCTPAAFPQDDLPRTLLGFYPVADSISQFPDVNHPLTLLCQKKMEGRYVSFIGRKNEKKIFIAAVTLKPIKDVNKEISRIVNFDGPRPNAGQVTTWGYVFDRNNDGKIDYMALIGGAGAFEDDRMPPDYPRRGEPHSMKQMEYFVNHCRLIFNHCADDNFDGAIDGAVVADSDPGRDFVHRMIFIGSRSEGGAFDDVWGFQGKLTPLTDRDTVAHEPGSVPYHPPGKPAGEVTKKILDEKSALLDLLNRAAATCKVGSEIKE
jgi:hypothetical protein